MLLFLFLLENTTSTIFDQNQVNLVGLSESQLVQLVTIFITSLPHPTLAMTTSSHIF